MNKECLWWHSISIVHMAKERISEIEDGLIEMSQTKIKREQKRIFKKTIQELWDNFKIYSIYILIPERKESGNEAEKTLTVIMSVNFPKLHHTKLREHQGG